MLQDGAGQQQRQGGWNPFRALFASRGAAGGSGVAPRGQRRGRKEDKGDAPPSTNKAQRELSEAWGRLLYNCERS